MLPQKNISKQDPAKVFISHQNFASNNKIFYTEHIKAINRGIRLHPSQPILNFWNMQQQQQQIQYNGAAKARQLSPSRMQSSKENCSLIYASFPHISGLVSQPSTWFFCCYKLPQTKTTPPPSTDKFPTFLRFPLSLSEAYPIGNRKTFSVKLKSLQNGEKFLSPGVPRKISRGDFFLQKRRTRRFAISLSLVEAKSPS